MPSAVKFIAILVFLVATFPFTGQAQCPSRPSMSGDWNGSDGGKYRVRQRGKVVWWVGTSSDNGKTFINVFNGVRNGLIVDGTWADVVGTGFGTLRLKIEGEGDTKAFDFTKVGETGTGFGGRHWSFPCNDTNPIPAPE